jgi:aspartyl protease/tetratricopeptide repeat protein
VSIRSLCWYFFVIAAPILYGAESDDALAMGRKALRNDGVSTAWKAAQKAVADAPESAAAHEFSGEVLFRRGEFPQAEAEFTTAIKLDSNYALARWGLARVNECASLSKTALDNFRHAYALDPKDPRIFLDWAVRLPAQQQADALEKYSSMAGRSDAESDPADLDQRLQFARAFRGRALTVLASAYTKTEIPLATLIGEKNHMRSFGLEVSLNGNVFRLVLDTGASGIVIPRRAAAKAGVTRLSQATMRGFGDSSKLSAGYRGVAERLRIGDVEYRDALISVSDQDSVGTADGLIGTNVFGAFLVTLDFAGKKLRLDPLPGYHPGDNQIQDRIVPPGMEHATRVFRFGHLLLLPTRVNGSRDALFVIDSGADRTLISYDLAAEVSKLSRDSKMRMSGINGQVADLYQTGDLVLQFAGFEQKNLGMSSVDTWDQSHRIGTEISGFLGLPVLDLFTLTIDYRDGLVNFERPAR